LKNHREKGHVCPSRKGDPELRKGAWADGNAVEGGPFYHPSKGRGRPTWFGEKGYRGESRPAPGQGVNVPSP